ncbi:hypothetical protein [Herbiconiux daphne]|uniref:Uncharacterized protein n=1 Tax=Herbiconiux daphne TaxID=2970914 RepID=A0ABT2H6I8_9MICO|nr:hypothetical protein [Herbiconiux daphne]MCS5735534.1 hypothetical protein [Herbiconiux daphne]
MTHPDVTGQPAGGAAAGEAPLNPVPGEHPAAPRARRDPVIDRVAARVEGRHPDWVVDHAFAVGWIWFVAWALLLVPADLFDWHILIWVGISVVAGLPTIVAGAICLWRTPESHLAREPSVLGHFLTRFFAVVFGFGVWTLSVVVSTVLALVLPTLDDDSDSRAINDGLYLLGASVPLVASLLLVILTVRCSYFLLRLRGVARRPRHTRMPHSFLSESPRSHRLIVGLANPLLLLAGGGLTSVIVVAGTVFDITLRLVTQV